MFGHVTAPPAAAVPSSCMASPYKTIQFSLTRLPDRSSVRRSSLEIMHVIRRRSAIIGSLSASSIVALERTTAAAQPAAAVSHPPDSFNQYIIDAVGYISQSRAGQGYDINSVLTQNLTYGTAQIRATNPPLTMCVAAIVEVIVTALERYVAQTGNRSIYAHLPAESWSRLRPTDIKSHIWVDPRLGAFGTADALDMFGVGARARFTDLTPGSFINLNRNIPGRRPTGHAVVFLGYIDPQGNDLPAHGPNVAGFKYFSAQGQGLAPPVSGFGYRHAFFMRDRQLYCPRLGGGRIADCGVTLSLDQRYLNTGYMLAPERWDMARRDANLAALRQRLLGQTRSRGPSFLGLNGDVSEEDFDRFLQETDTMQLNPALNDVVATDG
jgi:hypothetical protein